MAEETFDVVVVGGGVTGAGTALDAASRGLRVALIEQRDYASGTSSRSSKLFHGGLRYLQRLEFHLVREALAERNLMARAICPYLVTPVSFLYPLRHRFWERLYVGAGVLIYDALARLSGSPFPGHQHLGRRGVARISPALDASKTQGAVRYWDATVDDARHTLTVIRTAARWGAKVASSTRVVGFDQDSGRITSVRAVDLETGRKLCIRARSVVNAAGVWSDDIQEMAGSYRLEVEASKGIHIVVPGDRIASETGVILRTETSVLFVIPFGGHWIIGTTDTPWELRRAHPAASRSDIEYLLSKVNEVLTSPLGPDDIIGVYAGLRPLLAGESDSTSKLSREHAVADCGNGMISIAGGKYTTYRVMARDAVDATAAYLGAIPPSPTESVPLIGSEGTAEGDLRLVGRYGSMGRDVADLISRDRRLGSPIVDDAPYLGAELVYAATHEGALHLDDFLTRRTRISIETRDRGLAAAPLVAELVAPILGWDDRAVAREVAHYRARVEAELDSQLQPDDQTADAARMGAPDVRTGSAE
jgi:glycerol-3-phosphate dehydrogenase